METDSSPTINQRLMQAGVGESHASMLANGKRTPSMRLALALEEKLGIPVSAWAQGPEAVRKALSLAPATASEAAR